MTLEEEFNSAVERTKMLNQRPSNDILLNLYALFKQVTIGDNQAKQPEGFDFKSLAKHNAWEAQKGKSRDECMKAYIELVQSLE